MQNPEHDKTESPQLSVEQIFAANTASNVAGSRIAEPGLRIEKYKPSGRVGQALWPLLAMFIPLSAIIVGYLRFSMVGDDEVLLISQGIIGFTAGLLLFPALRLGKCRNLKIGAFAGALACLLSYVAHTGFTVVDDRPAFVSSILKQAQLEGEVPDAEARAIIEDELTPMAYLKLWLQIRSENGAVLSESDDSDSGKSKGTDIRLTGTAFWLFEAGEALLASFFAAIAGLVIAAQRFSETQDKWYRKRLFRKFDEAKLPEVAHYVAKSDWQSVMQIIENSKTRNTVCGTLGLYYASGADDVVVILSQVQGYQPEVLFRASVPLDSVLAGYCKRS